MAKWTVWTKGMASETIIEADRVNTTAEAAIFVDAHGAPVAVVSMTELILAQANAPTQS